jgi:hypothetical protein
MALLHFFPIALQSFINYHLVELSNGEQYCLYAKERNEQDTLVGKPEEDRPFERSTHICEDNIKTDLEEDH